MKATLNDIIDLNWTWSSWELASTGFRGILNELRQSPPDYTPEAGLINISSGKYVWHLRRTGHGREYDFAFKHQYVTKSLRYILHPSLTAREIRNYKLFRGLGIPVPRVFAGGDVRRFLILRETFMATEFIPDSADGRVFMPGGAQNGDTRRKLVYCRKHLALLAKIHDHGIFHKAYHPRNLLWRERGDDMEVFWIDVARCREAGAGSMPRAVVVDLHTFFRDMRLTRAETAELLEYYLSCRTRGAIPADAASLMDSLIHFRRRLFSSKRYPLFAD